MKSSKKIIACVVLSSVLVLLFSYLFFISPPKAEASLSVGNSPTMSLQQGLVGYWTMDGQDINWATGQAVDVIGNGKQ